MPAPGLPVDRQWGQSRSAAHGRPASTAVTVGRIRATRAASNADGGANAAHDGGSMCRNCSRGRVARAVLTSIIVFNVVVVALEATGHLDSSMQAAMSFGDAAASQLGGTSASPVADTATVARHEFVGTAAAAVTASDAPMRTRPVERSAMQEPQQPEQQQQQQQQPPPPLVADAQAITGASSASGSAEGSEADELGEFGSTPGADAQGTTPGNSDGGVPGGLGGSPDAGDAAALADGGEGDAATAGASAGDKGTDVQTGTPVVVQAFPPCTSETTEGLVLVADTRRLEWSWKTAMPGPTSRTQKKRGPTGPVEPLYVGRAAAIADAEAVVDWVKVMMGRPDSAALLDLNLPVPVDAFLPGNMNAGEGGGGAGGAAELSAAASSMAALLDGPRVAALGKASMLITAPTPLLPLLAAALKPGAIMLVLSPGIAADVDYVVSHAWKDAVEAAGAKWHSVVVPIDFGAIKGGISTAEAACHDMPMSFCPVADMGLPLGAVQARQAGVLPGGHLLFGRMAWDKAPPSKIENDDDVHPRSFTLRVLKGLLENMRCSVGEPGPDVPPLSTAGDAIAAATAVALPGRAGSVRPAGTTAAEAESAAADAKAATEEAETAAAEAAAAAAAAAQAAGIAATGGMVESPLSRVTISGEDTASPEAHFLMHTAPVVDMALMGVRSMIPRTLNTTHMGGDLQVTRDMYVALGTKNKGKQMEDAAYAMSKHSSVHVAGPSHDGVLMDDMQRCVMDTAVEWGAGAAVVDGIARSDAASRAQWGMSGSGESRGDNIAGGWQRALAQLARWEEHISSVERVLPEELAAYVGEDSGGADGDGGMCSPGLMAALADMHNAFMRPGVELPVVYDAVQLSPQQARESALFKAEADAEEAAAKARKEAATLAAQAEAEERAAAVLRSRGVEDATGAPLALGGGAGGGDTTHGNAGSGSARGTGTGSGTGSGTTATGSPAAAATAAVAGAGAGSARRLSALGFNVGERAVSSAQAAERAGRALAAASPRWTPPASGGAAGRTTGVNVNPAVTRVVTRAGSVRVGPSAGTAKTSQITPKARTSPQPASGTAGTTRPGITRAGVTRAGATHYPKSAGYTRVGSTNVNRGTGRTTTYRHQTARTVRRSPPKKKETPEQKRATKLRTGALQVATWARRLYHACGLRLMAHRVRRLDAAVEALVATPQARERFPGATGPEDARAALALECLDQTISVVTPRSSAVCSRQVGQQYGYTTETSFHGQACSCDLYDVALDTQADAESRRARFEVTTRAELITARHVLSCGRPSINAGALGADTGWLSTDSVSVAASVGAFPGGDVRLIDVMIVPPPSPPGANAGDGGGDSAGGDGGVWGPADTRSYIASARRNASQPWVRSPAYIRGADPYPNYYHEFVYRTMPAGLTRLRPLRGWHSRLGAAPAGDGVGTAAGGVYPADTEEALADARALVVAPRARALSADMPPSWWLRAPEAARCPSVFQPECHVLYGAWRSGPVVPAGQTTSFSALRIGIAPVVMLAMKYPATRAMLAYVGDGARALGTQASLAVEAPGADATGHIGGAVVGGGTVAMDDDDGGGGGDGGAYSDTDGGVREWAPDTDVRHFFTTRVTADVNVTGVNGTFTTEQQTTFVESECTLAAPFVAMELRDGEKQSRPVLNKEDVLWACDQLADLTLAQFVERHAPQLAAALESAATSERAKGCPGDAAAQLRALPAAACERFKFESRESAEEYVRRARELDVYVAPHGSGWANTQLMRPGSSAVLLSSNWPYFYGYAAGYGSYFLAELAATAALHDVTVWHVWLEPNIPAWGNQVRTLDTRVWTLEALHQSVKAGVWAHLYHLTPALVQALTQQWMRRLEAY